jgi:hypothetical protein
MGRADGGWRIVVRIGAGQPELQAALAAVPARARAERLRQLAIIGLCRLPHEAPPVRPRNPVRSRRCRPGANGSCKGCSAMRTSSDKPLKMRWRHRCGLPSRRRRRLGALLLVAAALEAHAIDLTGTRWDVSAHRFGLDPRLLYALALAASARPAAAGAVAPWPWTLRLPEGVRFYATQSKALAALRSRLQSGAPDIGIGLFGISPEAAKSRVGDPATMLDGPTSLVVAADMLSTAMDAAGGDHALGIGQLRYPANRRAARAYGRQVLRLQRAIGGSPANTPSDDVLDRWRASAVLDLVAAPESGGNYNAWYGAADQQAAPLIALTLGDVRALQAQLVRATGGSAIGRYQFIAPTLARLVARMGLTGQAHFTPALQDRLAGELLREAGLAAWLDGRLPDASFAANLARSWAALPRDASNRSVYAGLAGNRATRKWEAVVATLRAIRTGSRLSATADPARGPGD